MKENGRGKNPGRRGGIVRRSRTAHNAAPRGTVEEVAAQLAPLEEQTAARRAHAGDNGGAIVVDTGTLKLPEGLVEEKAKRNRLWRIEPVVALIIALALAFIIFIAWEISRMPPPTG